MSHRRIQLDDSWLRDLCVPVRLTRSKHSLTHPHAHTLTHACTHSHLSLCHEHTHSHFDRPAPMQETLLPLNNFSLDVSLTLLAAYFLKITPIKVTHTKLNSLSLIHTRSSHTPTLLHHTHKRLHQAWFITFLKGCHHPGGSFIY